MDKKLSVDLLNCSVAGELTAVHHFCTKQLPLDKILDKVYRI